MTDSDQLTRFRKSREWFVGRFKRAELPCVQGPRSFEKYLAIRDIVLIRTERPPVSEPVTNNNCVPVGQERNNNSSDRQEMHVLMDNHRP